MASENDVSVKFGADIGEAVAGINRISEMMEGLGSNVAGVTEPFAKLGESIVGAFALEKIDEFIEKIGDLGLQVERTSQQLGLSVQQVSLLNYAAETNDVSTQQMRNSLERLTVGLQAAQEGTNKQSDAFKALAGESAQQFIKSGGDMNELIERISKNTVALQGHTNLAADYIALMGRSGADAIPVFLDLGQNMDKLKEKLADAGLGFNPKFIDDIAETRKANIDLKEANSGLGASFFEILKPAIDGLLLILRSFVQALQDSIQYGGLLNVAMQVLTGTFLVLESIIMVVADIIKTIFQILETLIQEFGIAVAGVGEMIWDALHGHFQQVKDDFKNTTTAMSQYFDEQAENIVKRNKETQDDLSKSWSNFWQNLSGQSGASNTDTSSGAKGGAVGGVNTQADLKAMNEDIQNHKAMLDEELADVGTNLKAKMLLEQQYYDWLAQKYPQDQKAIDAAGKMIAQTQNQEIKEMDQKWNGFFGSFNQGINGMLTGTGNWRKAMANMALSVVDTFLKAIEQMVAHWIDSEIVKTSATNAGNAARLASNAASAKAGATAQAAVDSTSILKNAYTAASGAYASTAAIPIVGPILAPAAAAVAFGATAAFASFDVGTPYVPNTGLAMVHQGEAIIPANMNKGQFGGGNEVHFHVNAIDAQGVQDFFNTHGGIMAQQLVDSYQRGNPAFRYPR